MPLFRQCLDLPGLFQYLADLDGGLLWRTLGGVDHQFGLLGRLVGIVDAGKALDLSGAGFFVEPLGIALFTNRQGRVAENLEEVARPHRLPSDVAIFQIGADERGEGNDSGIHKQLAHLADAADVFLAIFGTEAQILVQAVANVVAVQHISQVATLNQGVLQGVCNGALARPAQPGKPDERPVLIKKRLARLPPYMAFVPRDVRGFDVRHAAAPVNAYLRKMLHL